MSTQKLTASTVTAANDFFFQDLIVLAGDAGDAATRFRAHLASLEAQAGEVAEFEMGQVSDMTEMGEMDDPADFEPTPHKSYAYRFKDDQVAEFDGEWAATKQVDTMRSGGIGLACKGG